MKPIFLMEDVNLSVFDLSLDKNTITIELLDMYEGAQICTMTLFDIMKISYYCFEHEEELLSAYLGKISVEYGSFKLPEAAFCDIPSESYRVTMEGSLDLDVLCVKCEILNSKK